MPARPRLTAEARRVRARIASKSRYTPGDPAIEDDRRELAALNLEDHIRRVVDAAPPLTDEQRERLALLLAPVASTVAASRAARTTHARATA